MIPSLVEYILKLSLSLVIIYLFYQLLLRRLTFYNHNRWFLLGYSLISFLIPFINITPILEKNEWTNTRAVNVIPVLQTYTNKVETITDCPAPIGLANWDKSEWMLLAIGCGAFLLVCRLLLHYFSYLNIRQRAELVSDGDIKVYQVNRNIIPFSFGNAIFINSRLHSEAELKEIVRHEFVHVRQKHTIDIIWSELLCVFNWYNPAAWMIRRSIRQNLEFIADDKVVQSGMDRKQYQYLLLKVIGNNHFSIANNFNSSSLKKRIAMMNKIKSGKVQLLKFSFLLPLLIVVLLAFRGRTTGNTQQNYNAGVKKQDAAGDVKKTDGELSAGNNTTQPIRVAVKRSQPVDTVRPNSKGYFISIEDNKGNCTIVIKDRNRKEVNRMLLTDWNKKEDYYENLYGEILPPPKVVPVPSAPSTLSAPPVVAEELVAPIPLQSPVKAEKAALIPVAPVASAAPTVPAAPAVPEVIELPANVKSINVTDKKASVTLIDGKVENYDLNKSAEKTQFEKKYGKLPTPPTPPVVTREL